MNIFPLHSNGRAFLEGGDIYYSPNCRRTVRVPPLPDPSRYKFRESLDVGNLKGPVWWNEPYGWLSFLLLNPQASFFGVPLSPLNIGPYPPIETVGAKGYRYKLAREITESWERLEWALICATTIMARTLQIGPGLRMPPPIMFGYKLLYKSAANARARAFMARDAFGPLLAFLSYMIASLKTSSREIMNESDVPQWVLHLKERNFSEAWLNGLLASDVCQFYSTTPRAGVFFDWLDKDPTRPSVEWFCAHHIPVWYRWTSAHTNEVRHNPRFSYLTPPSHILQSVATVLVQQPQISPPASEFALKLPVSEFTTPVQTITPTPTLPPTSTTRIPEWKIFLEQRERRFALREQHESPKQRESRKQRERARGIVKAAIFEWVKSESDDNVWVRRRVSKKFNEETWSEYGSQQKIYNAWDNEWDLCDAFGTDDPDSDTEEGDVNGGEEREMNDEENIRQEVSEAELNDFIQLRSFQSSPPPAQLSAQDTQIDRRPDLLETATHFYGFVPPIPSISSTQSAQVATASKWEETMKTLGFIAEEEDMPSPEISFALVSFVSCLRGLKSPESDCWDLSLDNRVPLVCTAAIPIIRRIGKGLYLLMSPKSDTSWMLGFSLATHVLLAARVLNAYQFSTFKLAEFLIRSGIPFRTLSWVPQLTPIPIASPFCILPFRLSGFQFTSSDYSAYVQVREAILSSPRGRAALMHGGIIWRLAREHLTDDLVLAGPSSIATTEKMGYFVEDASSKSMLCDDDLTECEIELICGLHMCFTNCGSQTAKKSWWPLPTQWNGLDNGNRWGRWTDWNEHWYQTRLTQIQNNHSLGQPFAATVWRSKLKGMKFTKTLTSHLESVSQDFLAEHVQ